jgi:hypothetical protein
MRLNDEPEGIGYSFERILNTTKYLLARSDHINIIMNIACLIMPSREIQSLRPC